MEEKEIKEKRGNRLIIIVLSILLLFALVYIVYDKLSSKEDNKNERNNNSKVVENTINPELENAILFANNVENDLIAVTSDGNQVNIFNYDENKYSSFYDYDEEEKVIYISLVDKDRKHYIGLIDLKKGNQNYKVEILKEFDDDKEYFWYTNARIAKVDNYIFIAGKGIYRYDIKEDKLEKTSIFNDNRLIWFTKYKSNLLYQFGDDIYILNVKTNEKDLILSNASLGYVYNDKLIYYQHKDSTGE